MAGRDLLQRLLASLAGLVRTVADVLDRAAGRASPDIRSEVVAALAERFPGAPAHWLRIIAERAPHLSDTREETPAAPRPRVGFRLPWPRRASPPPPTRPPPLRTRPETVMRDAPSTAPLAPVTAEPEPTGPAIDDSLAREIVRAVRAERPQLIFPRPRHMASPPASQPLSPPPARPTPRLAGFLSAQPRPSAGAATSAPSSVKQEVSSEHRLETDTSAVRAERSFQPPAAATRAETLRWTDLQAARRPDPTPSDWSDARAAEDPQPWPGLPLFAPDRQDLAFTQAPAPRAAPARWENAAAASRQAQPDLPISAPRPPAELPRFKRRADSPWPALPPADQGETAEAPRTDPARHVREQEFGGWSE